jgi:GNAT superfamily N-acetyltransferase
VWRSLFLQRYSVVIYTYSPRQGKGRLDEGVRVLSRDSPIPRDVKREFVRASGSRAWWAGRFMMVRQGAKLLYLLEDGKLCAYGWIRRLDPFLRCFRWLTPRGTVLGYFWTAPEKRGLGLYGRLLRHCIAISKDREEVPVIVYAASSNRGSLHGIEKAGFARLGEYEITTRCSTCCTRTGSSRRRRRSPKSWPECEDRVAASSQQLAI